MFSCRRESDDVADVCGRGGGADVDYAVCRDDRDLGAGDSAALRRGRKPDPGRNLVQEIADGWGKAGWRAHIARSAWTPQGQGITIEASESVRMRGRRSLPTMMQKPVNRPCPVPDSFISTFIRPIRC